MISASRKVRLSVADSYALSEGVRIIEPHEHEWNYLRRVLFRWPVGSTITFATPADDPAPRQIVVTRIEDDEDA